MVKISSITALGFLMMLTPFLSTPREWKDTLMFIFGFGVVVLSFLIRKELHKVIRIVHGVEEDKPDTYVENNPQ